MPTEPPVFAEERRQRIADIVAAHGRVRLSELVETLGVTEPTIRKDLSALEGRRLLRRTHGGAISVQASSSERSMDDRSLLNRAAKQAIAEACQGEINVGDSVFLDTGTTVEAVAAHLGPLDISVLTNALGVAELVAQQPTIRHTLVGGQLRPLGKSLTGPVALDNLSRFNVDVAVIGATGLTQDGIFVADLGEAQIKQSVVDRARRVILALDSTKFGQTDFVTVCGLDRIDTIVTDRAPREVREWCERFQIALVVAGEPG